VLRTLALGLLLVALCLASACRREAPASGDKRYAVTGRVVEVEAASRSVTLAHEEIPGFMPAMTMPFVVLERDAALLQAMAPGDSLQGVLVVADSRYWLEELVIVKPAVPLPGAPPLASPREPQPGDPVPDVELVDQDGQALRLASYRGQALALTFVFTRCPMPDFCPFLMSGFARVHETLAADAALARQTALLTVSFDVVYDTPAVLRAYGLPFQRTKPPFTHWRLASGSLAEVRRLGAALGLDFHEEERSFAHNLRTAVIGKDGRLRRLFRGNDWKAQELRAELEAAAGGS
jgi:protein SCO1/2